MYYIGVDLGTSSVKLLTIDSSGKIYGEVSCEYPVSYPKENWAEQNPNDWWDKTLEALNKTFTLENISKEKILGIGFSGQMHGLVALDKSGEVLTPAMLWCDQRTQEECDDITKYFGEKRLSELVGNKALTGFTAPKILWLKKNKPEIFKRIDKILLPKDYVRYKLTGIYATDYSDASGMLLLDVKNKCWNKEMLEFLGLKEEQLPSLFESYEVVSDLTDAIKEELGITHKVVVVAGAGDQAAGAIGTGTIEEGIISVTLGTSGVVFAAHDDYHVDPENRLHAFCHSNGKYHSMGVMLSAANCLQWWVNQIQDTNDFDKLLLEADEEISKVVFLPYLMGERTPYANPDARGTFIGMDMNTRRGTMTRAVLEGVIFGLKDSLDIIKDMNLPIKEIRVIGGGSKSSLWKQIIADIFGQAIYGINTSQGGALGAAILAAVGVGTYSDVEEACKNIIKTIDCVEPIEENASVYTSKHKKYKELYFALEEYFSNN